MTFNLVDTLDLNEKHQQVFSLVSLNTTRYKKQENKTPRYYYKMKQVVKDGVMLVILKLYLTKKKQDKSLHSGLVWHLYSSQSAVKIFTVSVYKRKKGAVQCLDREMAEANVMFRKGELIQCRESRSDLTRNDWYEVDRNFYGRPRERVYIVSDDAGDSFDYRQSYFKLRASPVAKPETPKPSEFVKGQVVECVNNNEYTLYLTVGRQYKVLKAETDDPGWISIARGDGKPLGVYARRFKAIEESQTKPAEFIKGQVVECVRNDDGYRHSFTIGKQYVVIEFITYSTGRPSIRVCNNIGRSVSLYADRFRAVPAGMKRVVTAPSFNKGDIVQCISDANKYVSQGTTYTVLGTYSSKYGDKILIKPDSDSLGNCRYPSREFKMFFASVEVTKTGSETVTKVPQSVEVTRKEEEDTKGGSNSMEQDNNSMMSTFKGYFKKNQDTLMTLGVVVLLDEFLLGGGLRDRIKRTIESILGGLEKRIAGDVDDGTTDDK